jgi:hypothetical protein
MPKFGSNCRLNGHFAQVRTNDQLTHRKLAKTIPCCANATPSINQNQNNNNHDAGVRVHKQ